MYRVIYRVAPARHHQVLRLPRHQPFRAQLLNRVYKIICIYTCRTLSLSVYIYIHICICMCIYVYIHIHPSMRLTRRPSGAASAERTAFSDTTPQSYIISMYMYIYIYIYIYTYIYI